jgi:hypothetical protein
VYAPGLRVVNRATPYPMHRKLNIRFQSILPSSAIMLADVFASRKSSFISPISSISIMDRPARVARMEAGVSSCRAYLIGKMSAVEDHERKDIPKLAYRNELRSPSDANLSKTPSPSFRPSTAARSCTTWATCSRVYMSVFTMRHLSANK